MSTKRSFLSKLPVKQLKRIPGPRRIARRRQTLFDPLVDGDDPLGTLVVRIHAGRDLVAKDKNGFSDPYVVIRYGSSRVRPPFLSPLPSFPSLPLADPATVLPAHRSRARPSPSRSTRSGAPAARRAT